MPENAPDRNERVVVIHRAGTAAEAAVIRSLLESAGIESPSKVTVEIFPMREAPEGFTDCDILALESQAEDARLLIASLPADDSGVDPASEDAPDAARAGRRD
jgi:hypothetical protein